MDQPSASRDLHILQVTDCHLYSDTDENLLGVNTLDSFLEVLAAAVPDHEPLPDAVIATGDLVHDCSETGYHRLAEAIRPLSKHKATLPGNHDDPRVMEQVLPGYGIQVCGTLELGDWCLVLLDSHQAGQESGFLPESELARLDRVIRGFSGHILIFVHHHPLPIGSPWLDRIALTNGEELLERVRRHPGIKGVIWGHVHQQWRQRLNQAELLATPSTCIQFDPGASQFALALEPPGWRNLTLHADGRLSSEVFHLPRMPLGLAVDSAGY